MHRESSWITKCSTPASWCLILFVCPPLLHWLFQRFPLTAAAKWARLKVTDWEYMFKYICKCIYSFPFLLCFSLPLTGVKMTHLQFKPERALLFRKNKCIAHPHPPPFIEFHTLFACLLTLIPGLTRSLTKLVILFFDHLLVIPAEVFPAPQRSRLGLSWQLPRKASDPNQTLWHNRYVPPESPWSLVACIALYLPEKFRVRSML